MPVPPNQYLTDFSSLLIGLLSPEILQHPGSIAFVYIPVEVWSELLTHWKWVRSELLTQLLTELLTKSYSQKVINDEVSY